MKIKHFVAKYGIYIMLFFYSIGLLIGLSGCAITPDGHVTSAGSALYTYDLEKADGSKLHLTLQSSRDVQGVEFEMTPEGVVKAKVASTQGTVEAIGLAKSAIDTLKTAAEKAP